MHTPGPWKLTHFTGNNAKPQPFYTVTSEYNHIARVFIHPVGAPAARETGEANAALIVAAPEMLYALQRIADFAWSENDQRQSDIHRIASEAIAKAANAPQNQ